MVVEIDDPNPPPPIHVSPTKTVSVPVPKVKVTKKITKERSTLTDEEAAAFKAWERRKGRATLNTDAVNELKQQAADRTSGADFSARLALYKFCLDEYKVSDTRALEVARAAFQLPHISKYHNAQNFISALENARDDILDAGGYCDEPMVVEKLMSSLLGPNNTGPYKDFVTNYYLLREMGYMNIDLSSVTTSLLTFESTLQSDITHSFERVPHAFRSPRQGLVNYQRSSNVYYRAPHDPGQTRNGTQYNGPREQCSSCGT
ncbi:hypothetical protein LTR27_006936 [Elasticomyces elasticus]|nr:hypothetical protein LTR27_006936 [Elasticomyces elasticus]